MAHQCSHVTDEEFCEDLTKPVHVMVTVEVLGEGINIRNADTCMFVEPRNSYRSVIQAIGRVLRHHPSKTLAHVVFPAMAVPANVNAKETTLNDPDVSSGGRHPYLHQDAEAVGTVLEKTPTRAEAQQQEQLSTDVAAIGRGEGGQGKTISNGSSHKSITTFSRWSRQRLVGNHQIQGVGGASRCRNRQYDDLSSALLMCNLSQRYKQPLQGVQVCKEAQTRTRA